MSFPPAIKSLMPQTQSSPKPSTPYFGENPLLKSMGIKPVGWVPVYEIDDRISGVLLKVNENNRPLRPGVVQRYEDDMRTGRWHFTGDPLIMDTDGKLRSGQHRCSAAERCGTAFYAPVISNVPVEAFASIDTGAKRSPGNQLQITFGVQHATTIAAIIPRYLDIHENRTVGSGKKAMTSQAIVDWYRKNPQMHDLLQEAFQKATEVNKKFGGSTATMAAVYMVLREIDAKDTRKLFNQHLIKPIGWNEDGFPPATLAQFIRTECADGSRTSERDLVWGFIRTWNAWRQGSQLKLIRPRVEGKYSAIAPA